MYMYTHNSINYDTYSSMTYNKPVHYNKVKIQNTIFIMHNIGMAYLTAV